MEGSAVVQFKGLGSFINMQLAQPELYQENKFLKKSTLMIQNVFFNNKILTFL